MSKKPHNPPAFPRPASDINQNYSPDVTAQEGMMLRDYFAAKAMQSMVVGPPMPKRPEERGQDTVARYAYAMADAMLMMRSK